MFVFGMLSSLPGRLAIRENGMMISVMMPVLVAAGTMDVDNPI